MDVARLPGFNSSGSFGRRVFTEFSEVYEIDSDFQQEVESQFLWLLADVLASSAPGLATSAGGLHAR